MGEFFRALVDTSVFVPVKEMKGWTPALVWLHNGSDILIWLAFLVLPLVLGILARRRPATPYRSPVLLVCAAVLACGLTHFAMAVSVHLPVYWLAGAMKLATALVAWVAVAALVPAVPKIITWLDAADPGDRYVPPAERPESRARDYVIAVLTAVLIILVRAAFEPLLRGDHAFVLPLLAVVAVAWRSGFGPAVVTLLLSIAATIYFFIEPRFAFVVRELSDQIATGLFLFCGFTAALLGEAQREARRRAERSAIGLWAANDELAKSERQAAASLAQLETFLAHTPIGIAFFDPDLRYVRVNDYLAEVNGLPPVAHVGKTPGELGPQFPEDLDAAFRGVLATGEPLNNRRVAGRPGTDGRATEWEVSAYPVGDPVGGAVGLVVVAQDVTDRVRAEETRARLAAIVESSSDAIVSKTLEGGVTSWNPGAARLFGYAADEMIGASITRLIPPERLGEEDHILGSIGRGELVEPFDTVRRTKDGRLVPVSVGVSPIRDASGRVIGASKVARDITERKRTEEQLRESEARKAAVLETALDCVVTIDHEGKVVEFNPAAERTFGYRRDEVLGQDMAEFMIPPPLRAAHHAGLAWYLATGEGSVLNKRLELTAHRRDGTEFPVEVSITPAVVNGRPFFTSYLRDIADRKRAEEQLRKASEEFQTLADNIPQLAWMARPDGHIFWYNRQWYEYTGTTPADMEGWGWQAVHDPAALPEVVARWKATLATGEPFEMVFPLRGADGTFRPFLTQVNPVRDAAGNVARWFGTNTDVTERQRMIEDLRESAERFQTLTEAVPQIVWNADADGRVNYFNSRWREYTGLAAEGTRDGWVAAVHPDDADRVGVAWRDTVRDRGDRFAHEFRLRRADGGYRWFLSTAVPLRRADGTVDQWIGSLADIDDQVRYAERLEDEVRLRTVELRRSNEELEKFAYVASHDLQEPLRKIQAFGDRLAKKYRDVVGEHGRDYIDRMLASAGRMRTLINDLLAFSRVTSKGQPFAEIDLNEVVQGVVSDLEVRLGQADGRVDVGPLPTVTADPLQMRQLFQNLISNALKFHTPGQPAVVTISAVNLGAVSADADPPPGGADGWRITVTDNGIGFEQQYADRIFELFQRLHGRGDYEGTGLGLAICKKIVDRHGGTITARSSPGEGATFVIDLPVHPRPQGAE